MILLIWILKVSINLIVENYFHYGWGLKTRAVLKARVNVWRLVSFELDTDCLCYCVIDHSQAFVRSNWTSVCCYNLRSPKAEENGLTVAKVKVWMKLDNRMFRKAFWCLEGWDHLVWSQCRYQLKSMKHDIKSQGVVAYWLRLWAIDQLFNCKSLTISLVNKCKTVGDVVIILLLL